MNDTGNQAIRSPANGSGNPGASAPADGHPKFVKPFRMTRPADSITFDTRGSPRGQSQQAPVAETNQDAVRAEAPVARGEISQKQPERPAGTLSAPGKSPRRRVLRMALFALLPLVLIAADVRASSRRLAFRSRRAVFRVANKRLIRQRVRVRTRTDPVADNILGRIATGPA